MKMIWDEIDLERFPQRPALQKAAATVFGGRPEDVEVVDDVGASQGGPIVLELKKTGGDFPFRLGVYLDRPAKPGLDRLGAARGLAKALGTRILESGDDVNPYTRELVEPSGDVTTVTLEAALLDERGWARLTTAIPEVAQVALRTREAASARVSEILAIYQDIDVGVPVTSAPQATAVSALTDALFAARHAGAPTKDEKAKVAEAAAATRAAFAPRYVAGPSGLANLLEAAELITSGRLG